MQKLDIIKYTPADFPRLFEKVSTLPANYPLRHQGFVDYYYGSSEYCQLYLALDMDGDIAGFQGVERMPFVEGDRSHILGFGSNFYAFKPGSGTYLLINWIKTCDAGLVFGGSDDMNRLIDKAKWSRYEGVDFFFLNRRYHAAPDNPPLKRWLKKVLKKSPFRTPLHLLAGRVGSVDLEVREVSGFDAEIINFTSAFPFRFAPDVDYLNWRYGPNVPFVRYRTFAIRSSGTPAGFVTLLDNPEEIVVVHADGVNPRVLAAGIVQSISAMANGRNDKREVLVVTSNPEMRKVYERAGFRTRADWNRPLAIGKVPGGYKIPTPVSDWMVSFGWGDNAVRPPFRDGPPIANTTRAVATDQAPISS